jgi:sugar phosphate permease
MPSAPELPRQRALPALARRFPRIYYGWVIAVALCVQSIVVAGIGFYGMPVFLSALCREGGWELRDVSGALTLYMFCGGLFGTALGFGLDRFGPRRFFVPGGLVMAVALALFGRIETHAQLYLLFPLLSLGQTLCGGGPANAMLARWFAARRARAMSIAHTGVSIGGVLLIPGATRLIESHGLACATRVLALLVLLAVLPISVLVLRSDPRPLGLEIDGGAAPSRARPAVDWALQERRWSAREALRTRRFWALVAGFGGVLFCQIAVTTHLLQILADRMDAATAASAAALTPLGSIASRLVVGGFADRVHKGRLALGLVLLQSSAYLLLAAASTHAPLYAASLCFGFAIGNLFMLQPLMIGEHFGMRSFGVVSGLLSLATQVISSLGPVALGAAAQSLGGYAKVLPALAAIALASAIALSCVPSPAASSASRPAPR